MKLASKTTATEQAALALPKMNLLEMAMLAVDGVENESAEARAFYEAEVAGLLTEITKEKIDAYAGIIEHFTMEAEATLYRIGVITDREIGRLKERVARFQREAEKRSQMALQAMAVLGEKKLEGHYSTLKMNLAAPSIDYTEYDETKIPREFRKVVATVELPLAELPVYEVNGLPADEDEPGELEAYEFPVELIKLSYSIDKNALLKALKEPCEKCCGAGQVFYTQEQGSEDLVLPELPEPVICPTCNGRKTRLIPGARLQQKQGLKVA